MNMKAFGSAMEKILDGVTLWQISLSIGIILFAIFLRGPLVRRILKRVEKIAAKEEGEWKGDFTEAISPPLNALILIYGLLLSLSVLPLPVKPLNIKGMVDLAEFVTVLFLGLWLLSRSITILDMVIRKRALDPEHWLDTSLAPLITVTLRILLFVVGVIVIAQNLRYSVSALVASLGLGAAALALASQDTLANLFGSLMIMMDKPFTVGDWIKGADFEGTVEEIGLRSTRIRTFEKTVLNVPNSHIVNVIVENMDRRKDKDLDVRRIYMKLGLAMTATASDLEKAIVEIRELILAEPLVKSQFEPLVFFTEFGESTYDLMVIYYTSSNWREYLQGKQNINLSLMRKLDELGLSLAYPTRTVILEGEGGASNGALAKANMAPLPQAPESGA